MPADVVVLATGFLGDEKLKDMFASPRVKDIIAGSPDTAVPLYRECVHPRIPLMALVGDAEGLNNIYAVSRHVGLLEPPPRQRVQLLVGGAPANGGRVHVVPKRVPNDRDEAAEQEEEEEGAGAPRRVVPAVRRRRLRRHPVTTLG